MDHIRMVLKRVCEYGLDSCGPGYNPLAASCGRADEHSCSIEDAEFIE
jgi:hypothetical protein